MICTLGSKKDQALKSSLTPCSPSLSGIIRPADNVALYDDTKTRATQLLINQQL